MIKLNSKNRLMRLPLIVTSVILNILNISISWILIYLFFNKIVYKYLINYSSDLSFDNLKMALFLFLIFLGLGISIIMSYYIFWKQYSEN